MIWLKLLYDYSLDETKYNDILNERIGLEWEDDE